ncbi:S-adenosylmethionine:tRNA ribosyltransferase-isomerase (EC [Bathymodiolus thermophilus thioautotrophic gill symbiont]|uniref:tRNA preQ1(34) S-adenosylmethionine ribosyltransferase-isomerase QueA n=1 Tax=Bathymodiolus thermophilus thioautotrophic gill symbiont TaxID=2360 RepID=UPI00192A7FE0|nr:tRNA preQ1(34) S-adenosylmethionine ribosyltransferase-isomerase QueA [Bathymodiolus thermophilus thioautotrophic gill symbiont]CAB5496431.1 S-adenosylmethionine:tRNA ribosyltransferase-isomerase (EC [Bathymodiolus thermophilus thioautotrophic gill symbiont]
MQLKAFDFNLPGELIAQNPPKNRTDSRLLVGQSSIIDAQFNQIADFLQSGDLLVMNNTKVIPARLFGVKATGGKVEIMIERLLDENQALAMIRASRAPQINSKITLENGETATILNKQGSFYTLEFSTDSLLTLLDNVGHIPLPPYIERTDNQQDLDRYQTVYAQKDGAVAAPTAGLHFDDKLLTKLKNKGIDHAFVTLHVGAGTFVPVKTDNIEDHTMHSEIFEINPVTVDKINQTKANGGRIIAIGTTTVRVLESSIKNGKLIAQQGETDIFIYPGYQFQIVDSLITNFHLPKSSLLMLVSAFIGYTQMMAIYQHAIKERYRFFSYGDAMLLNKQNKQ